MPSPRGLAAAVVVLCAAAATARADDVYTGHAIVSGTGPASRAEALPAALREVLVRRSGDPSLAGDPRVAALDAAALLQDDVFLDRMSDIPHHDEQGTRDRPWDYIAHFDPDGVGRALAALGRREWTGPRPRLAARIAVHDLAGGEYAMNNDGDEGERLRRALLAAADRYGLRVALPPRAAPEEALPGTRDLTGTLRWSDADFGWVGDWRMEWQGQTFAWGIKGVSFDAAFRDALRGAMAIMAGYPPPAGSAAD